MRIQSTISSQKNEQKADLDLQRFQMLELLLVHFKKNILYQSLKTKRDKEDAHKLNKTS